MRRLLRSSGWLALVAVTLSAFAQPLINFASPWLAGGTKFTLTGTCTSSAASGGAIAGTITISSAGGCTFIVAVNGATGARAPTGWTGTMHDQTQPTVPAWGETSSTATTITFSVPAAVSSSDVLAFGPLVGY